MSERFRLKRPIIALRNQEGKSTCAMIPANAVVVVEDFQEGERLLRILWEKEEMLVFVQDLRERSAPLVLDRKSVDSFSG